MLLRLALITACLSFQLHGDAGALIHPITQDLPPDGLPQGEEIEAAIQSMDGLIVATREMLEAQQQIHKLLIDYQQTKGAYMKDQQNRTVVLRLVKIAHALVTQIRQFHLSDAFDPDFLHELSFFSQIASKKNLPKP